MSDSILRKVPARSCDRPSALDASRRAPQSLSGPLTRGLRVRLTNQPHESVVCPVCVCVLQPACLSLPLVRDGLEPGSESLLQKFDKRCLPICNQGADFPQVTSDRWVTSCTCFELRFIVSITPSSLI